MSSEASKFKKLSGFPHVLIETLKGNQMRSLSWNSLSNFGLNTWRPMAGEWTLTALAMLLPLELPDYACQEDCEGDVKIAILSSQGSGRVFSDFGTRCLHGENQGSSWTRLLGLGSQSLELSVAFTDCTWSHQVRCEGFRWNDQHMSSFWNTSGFNHRHFGDARANHDYGARPSFTRYMHNQRATRTTLWISSGVAGQTVATTCEVQLPSSQSLFILAQEGGQGKPVGK